jgi:uncharacterized phage-associated protein
MGYEMANVFDVANYIIKKMGEVTAIKLQRLVYYSQAWHMVWEDVSLFKERIEAWANGPVCPELYEKYKGEFMIYDCGENSYNLTDQEIESINSVVQYYGDKKTQWLSDLTMIEKPWVDARKDIPLGVRGSSEIPLSSMVEYYSSL